MKGLIIALALLLGFPDPALAEERALACAWDSGDVIFSTMILNEAKTVDVVFDYDTDMLIRIHVDLTGAKKLPGIVTIKEGRVVHAFFARCVISQ